MPGWLTRHGRKATAAAFWLALVGGYAWYMAAHGLSPLRAFERVQEYLAGEPLYGPLLFITLYAIRPLIFFSAALLSVAAGFLFGPILGVAYTVIGANLGASLAYLLGRYFGSDVAYLDEDRGAGMLRRYAGGMRRNGFETVLVMRLLFLPYDLVNYASGVLSVRFVPFLLATVLGTLPGTVSFVLFGASSGGDLRAPSFDARVLAASVAVFVASLLLARLLRRRESRPSTTRSAP